VIEIRSYRSVFDLERRVYSVDRLRLNPGGVPVRGVAYFLVVLLSALLAGELPLVGFLVRALPWYLRDLALPGLAATVLGSLRLEGRTFHHAARALMRHRTGPRRLSGIVRSSTVGRVWHPPDLLVIPDGSDTELRRLRYRGPGAVLVAVEHERAGRAFEHGARGWARRGLGAELCIRPREQGAQLGAADVVSLAAGAVLLVDGPAADGRR
jgi:hypothetical protein